MDSLLSIICQAKQLELFDRFAWPCCYLGFNFIVGTQTKSSKGISVWACVRNYRSRRFVRLRVWESLTVRGRSNSSSINASTLTLAALAYLNNTVNGGSRIPRSYFEISF